MNDPKFKVREIAGTVGISAAFAALMDHQLMLQKQLPRFLEIVSIPSYSPDLAFSENVKWTKRLNGGQVPFLQTPTSITFQKTLTL